MARSTAWMGEVAFKALAPSPSFLTREHQKERILKHSLMLKEYCTLRVGQHPLHAYPEAELLKRKQRNLAKSILYI